ncbi:16S rRNA (cytosine(1402)-N(4))-methyltransferase RsmH [Futiania mangrovi]|uniref:Ribosomal RNA small subunit methyltransferase H n=1 Tax=Futiania mangrovi TaxID=2959716 RepID=A0A9J6P9K6_9PROT|nr:16S rRNA (cytosine(1402)-N(4))-methyltransferase RsmH [Futiania mangrovii]MCP1334945.1 16S rRNA (cytosine(1402)-N(4))-methyltransferase RsmH [Futiania mangrovii]
MSARPHVPVLLNEVLEVLAPAAGEVHVDGTFGAGGYTRAILQAAPCVVWGVDRDPRAAREAEVLAGEARERFRFVAGRFGEMDGLLRAEGVEAVDGVVLDIGVSSMQIDEAERGFSFMKDGPLDMRMSGEGESAADVVNTYPEGSLARIIAVYGEERAARRVARAIARARERQPLATTGALADVVAAALGGVRGDRIHPATRTFQALRIHVNDELGELVRGLFAAESLLAPGGRLVVVTFHSLEDRIVKRFFQERGGLTGGGSRHMPEVQGAQPTFRVLSRKAVEADEAEVAANPRARSAKLRAGVRLDVPVPANDGLRGRFLESFTLEAAA